MTQEQKMSIANTAINQLAESTGKLIAMTGANTFIIGNNGEITFKFKMCRKANYCRIKLNGKDLYDMEFLKITPKFSKTIKVYDDIYNDMLKPLFEEFTGLCLSMPRVRGINC